MRKKRKKIRRRNSKAKQQSTWPYAGRSGNVGGGEGIGCSRIGTRTVSSILRRVVTRRNERYRGPEHEEEEKEMDISVMTSRVRRNDTRVIGRYCNGSYGEVVMARSFPPPEPPPTPPPPSLHLFPSSASSPSQLLLLPLLLFLLLLYLTPYSYSVPPRIRKCARGMSRLDPTCPPIIILTGFNLNNAACGFHRHARARLIISRTNSPTRYPSMVCIPLAPRAATIIFFPSSIRSIYSPDPPLPTILSIRSSFLSLPPFR